MKQNRRNKLINSQLFLSSDIVSTSSKRKGRIIAYGLVTRYGPQVVKDSLSHFDVHRSSYTRMIRQRRNIMSQKLACNLITRTFHTCSFAFKVSGATKRTIDSSEQQHATQS